MYHKWDFIGHPSISMEDSIAINNAEHECPAQEILEKNNIGHWARDHSCDTLAKTVASVYHNLKKFPEAKLKFNEIISLVEICHS